MTCVDYTKGGGTMPSKDSGQKKSIKARNYMYQQQIDYLPEDMKSDVESVLNNLKGIDQWAWIIHKLDKQEGKAGYVAPHIHVMLHFTNPRSLNGVAEELHDAPEHVRKWDDNYKNGFAYLIHATEGARHKYQYSAQNVEANFDYVDLIKKISLEVGTHNSKTKIEKMLDAIAKGELSLKQAKSLLSGSEYANYATALNRAHTLFLERRADELHEEMLLKAENVNVYWLYGMSGTGKTRLAVAFAEGKGSYYKTTTTKDPFQFYQAEPIVILDELRPETIPYSELLAIFDPYSYGKVMMSSRYYNKMIACRMFIVTSPFSPTAFYDGYRIHKEDRGEQLYRRLTSVLWMDFDRIYDMRYDPYTGLYQVVNSKENKYSKGSKENSTDHNNLFEIA